MEVKMNQNAVKEKKGFWSAFMSFLAMGGFLVLMVLAVVVVIVISKLTS
jgi:Tfp pilus assembly protein PilZ